MGSTCKENLIGSYENKCCPSWASKVYGRHSQQSSSLSSVFSEMSKRNTNISYQRGATEMSRSLHGNKLLVNQEQELRPPFPAQRRLRKLLETGGKHHVCMRENPKWNREARKREGKQGAVSKHSNTAREMVVGLKIDIFIKEKNYKRK